MHLRHSVRLEREPTSIALVQRATWFEHIVGLLFLTAERVVAGPAVPTYAPF